MLFTGPSWVGESEKHLGVRSLSPLAPSSREGPPGDSDRVLRAHSAHLTVPGALLHKPGRLPLPQVFPVPVARGHAQKPMELWGKRRHLGVAWGTGAGGLPEEPPAPTYRTTSSLPALLLWHAQERPCQPAPGLPQRWPGDDHAPGEGLVLGRGLLSS